VKALRHPANKQTNKQTAMIVSLTCPSNKLGC